MTTPTTVAEVTVNREGSIINICLNRPEKKNALTRVMYNTLSDQLEAAEIDRSVRVIVLTGSGGNFTSGNDIGELSSIPDDEQNYVMRFITLLINASVPIVVAVEGLAVGIGATMLGYVDAVVVSEKSKLLYPFINLALPPEGGSTLFMPKLIGYSRAAQLLMRGKPISGKEAFNIGIATLLSADTEIKKDAQALAEEYAQKPPSMMRKTKLMLKGDTQAIINRIQEEAVELKKALKSDESKAVIRAMMKGGKSRA